MRKLASIQRIDALEPIPGKDRIVLASVLGWHVIVTKEDFHVGDLVVYIEIDSILPEKPEFEFLRPKKFKIKTIRLGGAVSQGICFPLSILPERDHPYELGEDVTEILGVKENDVDDPVPDEAPDACARPRQTPLQRYLMRFDWYRRRVQPPRADFPTQYVSKTDEVRIQQCPGLLKDKANEYVVSEKVDGSSATYLLVRHKGWFGRVKYDYYVCSRNRQLPVDDGSVYWRLEHKYQIRDKLMNMIGDKPFIAIQGECLGPKIQKNKYKLTDYQLRVFNLITPDKRWPSVAARDYLATRGLDFVPILDEHFRLPDTVDDMVFFSTGPSALGDTIREGVVVRSADGRTSFKCISPEFQLKYNL